MSRRNRVARTVEYCAAWGVIASVSGCGDGTAEAPAKGGTPAGTSNAVATQPATPPVVMGASTQPGLAPTAGMTTKEKAFMLPPSATQKDESGTMTQEQALAQARIMQAGDFDRSLPLERYAVMGFPSPELKWGPQEYLATASALQAMVDVPGQFPRYESPNSGRLFARMIDDANLAGLRDRAVPLEARLSTATQLQMEFEKVFAAYNRGSRPGSLLDDETLELADFQLRLNIEMFNLIREAAKVIPAGNPARASLSGRAKEQQVQLMAQLKAYLGAYTEKDSELYFLPVALERFAGRLEQRMPTLFPYLVSSDQMTVQGVMERIAAGFPDEKVKAAMSKAVAVLPEPRVEEPATTEPVK